MKKLIAIGGGDPNTPGGFPRTGSTRIDREIIRQSGKKNPKLLFIPTATKDSPGYINAIEKYFGKRLGCKIDVLRTVNVKISSGVIKGKILNADIIYVGGGNTLYMIKKWKKLGIDKILRQAYKTGVVMSGLSAGSICWFRYGTSDSRMLTDPTFKDYIRVSGLGWFNLTMSPHHITEKKRKPSIIKMIKKYGGVGLALDDYAAIEILNDKFRIITSKSIVTAHRVYKKGGKLHYEEIKTNRFFDLTYLSIRGAMK